MTDGPSGIKRRLRRQFRAQRDALDVTYRAGCAERATHTIGDHAMWRSALVVASYLPHQSEFDPSFLSRAAIAAGKKLVYPRVVNERLAFHSWRDGDATEATIGGVLQPLASAAGGACPFLSDCHRGDWGGGGKGAVPKPADDCRYQAAAVLFPAITGSQARIVWRACAVLAGADLRTQMPDRPLARTSSCHSRHLADITL